MKSNYTPSVNIIRDAQKDMEYLVTANAKNIASKIIGDFKNGFHSFNIIGSYGTGKSAFLWALQQSFSGKQNFFNLELSQWEKTDLISIVGEYGSLRETLNDILGVKSDFKSSQKLFAELYERYESLGNGGLLVISIDEFGKFLEFGAKNDPEKEMYFIQQLAEFVNDPSRNILLLTTLHQGVESYANELTENQRNEWRKVRGRLKEIPFNEPIEQLLHLASKHFIKLVGEVEESAYSKTLTRLQETNHIFSASSEQVLNLKNSLYPLDVFSAYTLTSALQRYGQNERSLFTFVQSTENLGVQEFLSTGNYFSIPSVYDYLLENFYSILTTKSNPDYSNWNTIRNSIERAEVIEGIEIGTAEKLIKTIGLLHIFSSKGAKIDDSFLIKYFSLELKEKEVNATLKLLSKYKIIRFVKFNFSYKLFEGTDVDIEGALIQVENELDGPGEFIPQLNQHFSFPVVTAKAVSYKLGTPRLFEYELSEFPIVKTPEGEIDGIINLVFNSELSSEEIQNQTKEHSNPIIYALFKNSARIQDALFDIEKTNQVLKNIQSDDDKVAIRELESIRKSTVNLLNHYVLDSLFNGKNVEWFYCGQRVDIQGKKELNKMLSIICEEVYPLTPVLRNELFNKHKVSGAIASARKNYFRALVNHFQEENLGFKSEKFPPAKTIYYTLLKQSGIHRKTSAGYELSAPEPDSFLYDLWNVSEDFLVSAKDEKQPILGLIELLSKAPYKLKQGVIDFWIPTFLFIRRGDYALYADGVFKPYINETEIYLTTRVPEQYEIKSFELNDLRLSFFNQYRRLLQQKESSSLNVATFIESIRPILLLYRDFNDYQKSTNRISKEAIAFRKVIENAKDPEIVFFDQFPKALGFTSTELLKSESNFDDYIFKFQFVINELKDAYNELLNRIEKFITAEIIGKKGAFPGYKNELSKRFESLKEHQLLPNHKTFILRVNSSLNDRNTWLASICQTIFGKSLTSINDKDELVLKENLKRIITELDNLSDIHSVIDDSSDEEIFKLDLTTKSKGLIPKIIRIPKSKVDDSKELLQKIHIELGDDKELRISLLAKLLKNELENE